MTMGVNWAIKAFFSFISGPRNSSISALAFLATLQVVVGAEAVDGDRAEGGEIDATSLDGIKQGEDDQSEAFKEFVVGRLRERHRWQFGQDAEKGFSGGVARADCRWLQARPAGGTGILEKRGWRRPGSYLRVPAPADREEADGERRRVVCRGGGLEVISTAG